MNLRENFLATLNYQEPEHVPLLCFGYWGDTLFKWAREGYITWEEANGYCDKWEAEEANSAESWSITKKLGFDWNWTPKFWVNASLYPLFEQEILETREDGSRVIRNREGLICLVKPGLESIAGEVGTTLTGREAWEEFYLPRLQVDDGRIDLEALRKLPAPEESEVPLGLHVGSLMGRMRNYLGIEELSYLWMDDEELYREIADTICNLCYTGTRKVLESGARFDFAFYWEDICYNHGPLIAPDVFREVCGPWYQKMGELLGSHGITLTALDCDGCIDALLPIWLDAGVNVMFPIEYGTWEASIAPWREKYGKQIRGIGGINKTVFARDKAAVDAEVERLKPLIDLGGYVPCVDHAIAPDAKYPLVEYFCQQMKKYL